LVETTKTLNGGAVTKKKKTPELNNKGSAAKRELELTLTVGILDNQKERNRKAPRFSGRRWLGRGVLDAGKPISRGSRKMNGRGGVFRVKKNSWGGRRV